MVFSEAEERATRAAKRVAAGTVWVNCFFVRELAAAWEAAPTPGLGREGGNWDFDSYCDVMNIARRKDHLPRSFSIGVGL